MTSDRRLATALALALLDPEGQGMTPGITEGAISRLRAALAEADAVALALELADLEELQARLYHDAVDAIAADEPGGRVRHEVLMALREAAGSIAGEVYAVLEAQLAGDE